MIAAAPRQSARSIVQDKAAGIGIPLNRRGHVLARAAARGKGASTLPGFVALLHLVDDVNAALAPHQTIGAVAITQGFQRITYFHRSILPTHWPRRPSAKRRRHMPDFALLIKTKSVFPPWILRAASNRARPAKW
jgi:hypothetical protein